MDVGRVPLKVGEIWILGESLNGSLRESAAPFSGRDVPTEVGSRNLFPLPAPPLRICETPFPPNFRHTVLAAARNSGGQHSYGPKARSIPALGNAQGAGPIDTLEG